MKARVKDRPWRVDGYRYLVEQKQWFWWYPVESYSDLQAAVNHARALTVNQIVWQGPNQDYQANPEAAK